MNDLYKVSGIFTDDVKRNHRCSIYMMMADHHKLNPVAIKWNELNTTLSYQYNVESLHITGILSTTLSEMSRSQMDDNTTDIIPLNSFNNLFIYQQ